MTTAPAQRIYFKNLDILRFIAAYMIVVLHCFALWESHYHQVPYKNLFSPETQVPIERIMKNLSFGVDIFFIISGFLLTYLLLAEKDKTGGVDVMKFYFRRAFRIWPLYFLLVLIGPLLTYFFNEQSPNYGLQFIFAGNFDMIAQGSKSTATDHLWSICVEEHFYLFCPLMIAFTPSKKLPLVLSSIILFSILFRTYMLFTSPEYGAHGYLNTFARVDVLAVGSFLGYLVYNNKIQFNHPLWARLMVYFLFLFVFLGTDIIECGTFFSATVKKYFYVLCTAYWIGNFMFHPKAIFVPKKTNIFHHFGKASYGIYMFNTVVIFLILHFFSKFSFQNFFWFLVLSHAGIFLVTILSYRFFELPFLALKEKYAVIQSGGALKNSPVKEVEVTEAVETNPQPQEDIPIPVMVEKR